jgi:cytoskeletal protein CcmA (bactofilin family)
MATKKRGWQDGQDPFGNNGSPSEPPPAGGSEGGMWAKSSPPPAREPSVRPPASDEGGLGTEAGVETRSVVESEPPRAKTDPPPPEATTVIAPSAPPMPVSTPPRVSARPVPIDDPSQPTTTIGPTIVVRGKMRSDENLVIQGRIEAEITSSKDIHLENSGIVNANMSVRSVRISGIVVGDIRAMNFVELMPDARVVGDIHTPRWIVRDGAAFRGNVVMEGLDHLANVRPKKGGATAKPAASSLQDPTLGGGAPAQSAASPAGGVFSPPAPIVPAATVPVAEPAQERDWMRRRR